MDEGIPDVSATENVFRISQTSHPVSATLVVFQGESSDIREYALFALLAQLTKGLALNELQEQEQTGSKRFLRRLLGTYVDSQHLHITAMNMYQLTVQGDCLPDFVDERIEEFLLEVRVGNICLGTPVSLSLWPRMFSTST